MCKRGQQIFLVILITWLVGCTSNQPLPTNTPSATFLYQVRVVEDGTLAPISSATVQLFFGSEFAPVIGVTDKNGVAVLNIDRTYPNTTVSRVIIASGYTGSDETVAIQEGLLTQRVTLIPLNGLSQTTPTVSPIILSPTITHLSPTLMPSPTIRVNTPNPTSTVSPTPLPSGFACIAFDINLFLDNESLTNCSSAENYEILERGTALEILNEELVYPEGGDCHSLAFKFVELDDGTKGWVWETALVNPVVGVCEQP